jgi:signal transduction histidine kinase
MLRVLLVASPLVSVISDKTVLTKTLSELLNNACKYTLLHESIVLKVSLEKSSTRASADTPLTSTDSGLGGILKFTIHNIEVEIPADQLPLIFERFHRVPGGDRWKQGARG